MIQLAEATPPECQVRDHATYEAWGGGLTLEQFLRREIRLRAHAWPQKALRTWFLKEGDTVLASCETYAEDKYYGFASVFTENRFRKKGYASLLVQRVMSRFSNAKGFLLFSEVGPAIYQKIGFEVIPSRGYEIEVGGSRETESAKLAAQLAARLRANSYNLKELTRSEFLSEYSGFEFNVAIRPDRDQFDWHWERESTYRELLEIKDATQFVALRSETGISIWMMDYKNKIYRALWFSETNPQSAQMMVRRAIDHAQRLNAKSLKIYRTPTNQDVLAYESTLRSDEIAMTFGPKTAEIHRVHWI